MNKKTILTTCLSLVMSWAAQAADFETANDAVKNMGVGWNLGNTLDANSQTITDITNSGYWGQQGMDSETCWGQPYATAELLQMMKNAGFGAIRVPVTWYNHMDADGKVKAEWMSRVKEVVDYVIGQGMYCILNVHHDTGADSYDSNGKLTGYHWIKADEANFTANQARFEYLWTQIAEEFKGYDQRLLFEGYNEMLDIKNSWCFASFASSSKYDAAIASSAYNAINSYAQSFVNTVRATGGNNAQRNLIVTTYAACSGSGSWNDHLQDPLKEMKLPTDEASNHLIFEVHSYPSIKGGLANAKAEVDQMLGDIETYLGAKAPVIIGEWGTANDIQNNTDDYYVKKDDKLGFASYFVEQAKAKGFATYYWMGLTDGAFRSQVPPFFNQPDLAMAIIKAYHGETNSFTFPSAGSGAEFVCFEGEKALDWGTGFSVSNAAFLVYDKTVQIYLTFKKTADSGADIQLYYGDWSSKPSFYVDGKSYNADYNPGGTVGASQTVAFSFSESVYNTLAQKGLIFHGSGVTVNKAVMKGEAAGIANTIYTVTENDAVYNLQGRRVLHPSKGIYIRNGRKYYVK